MAKLLKILCRVSTASASRRYFSQDCLVPRRGLVLGCYYDEVCSKIELTSAAESFNKACNGKLIESIELIGKIKPSKSYLLWGLHESFTSVAVVGLGQKNKPISDLEFINQDEERVRIASAAGCRALVDHDIWNICVESFGGFGQSAAEGAKLATFKFQEFKSKTTASGSEAQELDINLYELCPGELDTWHEGIVRADAQNLARRLAETPSNHMTPTIFTDKVCQLFSDNSNVKIKIHDCDWAKKEGMCAFLAVAQGSREAPKFLEISYSTATDSKCSGPACVLVGKGVTFDTGGISLKPATNMDHMRADMGGAACLIGCLHAVAHNELDINLHILIPLTENMPGGAAIKPGDVVRAYNGKSICIDNTDAEGRLILADALAYASSKFHPKWVIDIATLTGAMRVALGNAASGVFSNSNELYDTLQEAGCATGDRVWRFPLWHHYEKLVTEYDAYDVNNVGKGKGGGSCTAAAFLQQFVPKDIPWMHIDIAGVMGPNEGAGAVPYLGKGMTGRPTRTLIDFLKKQCDA